MKSMKLVISIVWPIALMIIGLYLFLFFRGAIAFDFGKIEYEETTGECVSVGHDTRRVNDVTADGRDVKREVYDLIYNYTYRVDGITYQASERHTRELEDYQSYQKDIEDSQKGVGRTKTIYYNPKKPEKYSFYYKNFEESASGTSRAFLIIAVLCIVVMFPVIIGMVILTSILRRKRR